MNSPDLRGGFLFLLFEFEIVMIISDDILRIYHTILNLEIEFKKIMIAYMNSIGEYIRSI